MMRKTALDKVGLLDEDFFMYGEDIDLSYRLMTEGYDNWYIPAKSSTIKGKAHKNHHSVMYMYFTKPCSSSYASIIATLAFGCTYRLKRPYM